MIVIACYITLRLDHHTFLYDNLNRIKTVQKRFGNPPMVIFGDFNIPKKEFKELVEGSLGGSFKYHYSDQEHAQTRYMETKDRVEKSYLDYFITRNIEVTSFGTNSPMGHSDHLTLELVFTVKVYSKVKVQREKVLSFEKMLKESGKISEEFQNCLKKENKT